MQSSTPRKPHQKLKPGWTAPVAPRQYPELTAFKILLDAGHQWRMDFSRADGRDRWFASDADKCPPIEWPWVGGFDPLPADWHALGVVHVFEFRAASDLDPEHAQAMREAVKRVFDEFAKDQAKKSDRLH